MFRFATVVIVFASVFPSVARAGRSLGTPVVKASWRIKAHSLGKACRIRYQLQDTPKLGNKPPIEKKCVARNDKAFKQTYDCLQDIAFAQMNAALRKRGLRLTKDRVTNIGAPHLHRRRIRQPTKKNREQLGLPKGSAAKYMEIPSYSEYGRGGFAHYDMPRFHRLAEDASGNYYLIKPIFAGKQKRVPACFEVTIHGGARPQPLHYGFRIPAKASYYGVVEIELPALLLNPRYVGSPVPPRP